MRVTETAADQAAAQREVAAYTRMSSLQGVHVPRLKAHGYTLAGRVYFVATEFLDVSLLLLLHRDVMCAFGRHMCICTSSFSTAPQLCLAWPNPIYIHSVQGPEAACA